MASKHYFIGQNKAGKFAVRITGAKRASAVRDTQEEAISAAKRLNPDDNLDVERIRNTQQGVRDQWREAS